MTEIDKSFFHQLCSFQDYDNICQVFISKTEDKENILSLDKKMNEIRRLQLKISKQKLSVEKLKFDLTILCKNFNDDILKTNKFITYTITEMFIVRAVFDEKQHYYNYDFRNFNSDEIIGVSTYFIKYK